MKRLFVGPKQKTIKNTNFFDMSITLIGDNKNNNISLSNDIPFEFWNDDNNAVEIDYYNQSLKRVTEPMEVMAYNPRLFSKCELPCNIKQICKNPDKILRVLDNKIETRNLFKNVLPMLEYYTIKGKDINDNIFKDISKEVIIQSPSGSGGAKTFFCNAENYERIKNKLKPDQFYSLSAYQKDNESYTIYGMIGNKQIEIMPPARQLFETSDNIEWIGSEYNINITNKVREKLIAYTLKACQIVQSRGYKGIFNIDFIFANDELYLIETNPRFGGTIGEVDKFLQDSGLPSIFEYNYLAFNNKEMPTTKNMEKSIYKI